MKISKELKKKEKNPAFRPVQIPQWVWMLPRTPEGCGFDARSGHVPRLWVRSLVMVHMTDDQSMSLSPSFFLPLSLNINKHMLGEDFLKTS